MCPHFNDYDPLSSNPNFITPPEDQMIPLQPFIADDTMFGTLYGCSGDHTISAPDFAPSGNMRKKISHFIVFI